MTQARKLAMALAASALAAAALAAPAGASSLTIDKTGMLKYTAAPGEANHLDLSFDFATWSYVVQDTGVPSISVSAKGCATVSAQVARCTWGSFVAITAQLGGSSSYAKDELDATTVTIHGGPGADTLIGGGGNVTLDGGGGLDTLTAGKGTTHLMAGPGGAVEYGGSGKSTYDGSPDADEVHARNGVAETITCGGGADVVDADPSDTVSADCETVTRGDAAAPAPAPDPGTPANPAPGDVQAPAPAGPTVLAAISTAPVTVDTHNRVPVRVGCPANAPARCIGRLTLSMLSSSGAKHAKLVAARRERRVLGRSHRFKVAAGKHKVVPVSLSRRGARIFRARGRRRARRSVKLDVAVALQTPTGTKVTHSTITVKARRRPHVRSRRR